MHYTLTLSGLALGKKLVFDYSQLQAHNQGCMVLKPAALYL